MADTANVIVGVAALYYHDTPGTAAASIVTQLGFTEDGSSITYTPTPNDVEVEEETISLNRVLQKEEITVTINMAEALMTNLARAIAGGVEVGVNIITIGAGAMRTMALKLVAVAPSPRTVRTIWLPAVNPTGAVGMSFRKGEKTVIPMEFKAYQRTAGATVVTITDS